MLNRITGKSMRIQKDEIDQFFSRYESRFNDALSGAEPDIEQTVNSFTENFLEATPLGIITGKNDNNFKEMITKGWSFYKDIGIQAMNILSKQITILDDFHALVKVNWNSTFVRKDKTDGEISFDVFYLIQKLEEDIKIFAYITGDEQQALKDQGLIS
jgi:hypothetical protein